VPKKDNLSIIIPAAGVGKRMRSYGPKSLIPLNHEETVISRQINLLKKLFLHHSEIIVVVGFESEKIIRNLPKWVKVIENENYATTNVARSIGMALRIASNNNVLIVYGDLVFNIHALGVDLWGDSCTVVDSKGMIREDEVGVSLLKNEVLNFEYGHFTKWAQIVYLRKRELELFSKFVWNRDKYKLFGYEALNYVLDHGGYIRAVEPVNMKIAEIDFAKDVDIARKIIN
jgi:choline kinase